MKKSWKGHEILSWKFRGNPGKLKGCALQWSD